MRRVNIVVAESHPLILYGLTSLLSAENDFNVVASCCDGVKCIQAIRDWSPDIALLDMCMPGLTGFDVLAAVRLERLCPRVVFLTASVKDRELVRAAGGGACAVISKEAAPRILVNCLRQIAAGRLLPLALWNAEHPPLALLSEEHPRGQKCFTPNLLTKRERQVMDLVSEGLSNKEVGRRLNLSEGTIKIHLHHIYQKLAIKNRTTLAVSTVSGRNALQVEDRDQHLEVLFDRRA
jgi:two-component system nitrate/nitrite response regulator NarL